MILCANPSAQVSKYQAEIEDAVLRVIRSDRFILGSEVEALEHEFADYIGAKHAIGVANGTDALELALRALELQPNDEVITVSHTAVATVAAIEAAGAVPVLVDVDPVTYTLNPNQLIEALSARTRAVIVVHLYGHAADIEKISAFCKQQNLILIEDCSQAHGAKWNGERLGSIGNIGCFSCYPTKNLGAIGDAGLVTTSDDGLANKIRMLREYGWRQRYVSEVPGRNSRLDELQAAVLRVKLRYLDSDNQKRRDLATQYSGLLCDEVLIPQVRHGTEHVFHLYVIRSKHRELLISKLKSQNIYAGIHYPMAVHLQPAYKGRVRTVRDLNVTEKLSKEVLSLPIYPELGSSAVSDVAKAINSFHRDQAL